MIKKVDEKPSFLITIDTEGDNLWSKLRKITTENAKNLPPFQNLCEKYGFKPTYLVNYEMAISPTFQEFGKSIIKRNTGEIGMHLHAWSNPPLYKLTEDDFACQPYLTEYPKDIIKQKIRYLTQLLEKIFNVKMDGHRGGRWGFNEWYAQILIENGYCVDCSVTPFVSWEGTKGDPSQKGGPNYINFPNQAYFINPSDISKPGKSPLLEVPVTIVKSCLYPRISWFRPDGKNLKAILKILRTALNEKKDYIEFMLHSSELTAGCNPTFKTEKDIEKLYKEIEIIFDEASKNFTGRTLKEYYDLNIK